MRRTAVLFAVVLIFLVAMSAGAAVRNIDLMSVGNQGITGTATAITSNVSGSMPYTNVELNAKVNSTPSANMRYEAWLYNSKTNNANSLGVFNGTMFNLRSRMSSFGTNMPYDSIAVSMEPINDMNPAPSTIVARGSLPGTALTSSNFSSMAVLPMDEMFQRSVIMQRFNLSSSQITDLRMRGWGHEDIAVMANAASKCNKNVMDVASAVEQGESWDMIASSCNISVAQLLEPVPLTAVAGYQGTITPTTGTGMVMAPVYYLRYASGKPVVTRDDWVQYSRRGYTWRDVAVAANISAQTGESVDDLLRMARVQGMTWRQIAVDRGLDVDQVMDVTMWPFEQGPARRDWQPGMYGSPGSSGTAGTMTMPSTTTPSMTPSETPSTTPSETPSMTPSETPSTTPSETPGTSAPGGTGTGSEATPPETNGY